MSTREIYKEAVRCKTAEKFEKLLNYTKEIVRILGLDGPCGDFSYRFEHGLKTDEECYKFVGYRDKEFYDLPEIPLDISGKTFLFNNTGSIES